ncbi:S41 family peptidase [Clostridium ganghwense]|uniref:S41 family peptidase n=1 Tax=Clostridium ganghwense TaxID=312089 RepID=A0ABT4CSB8_9CLOT|nr:S41 family peptidase [Clostridium ganghwense]MCY6370966.1 S41 family peptidase [Clostridium ganghwense]
MNLFKSKKINNKMNTLFLFLVSLIYALNFSYVNVSAADKIAEQGQVVEVSTETEAFTTLTQARALINNYYIEDVSDKIEDSKSVSEMIEALDDPYSSYFTKEEYESFVNIIDNKFCGIGIYLDIVDEGVKVLSTIGNSPAEEAGLQSGDIIIKVDGNTLQGKSSEEASKYLRGEEGTKIQLVVKRESKLLNFQVTRGVITNPTVINEVLKNDIGYIRISSFGEKTGDEFLNSLNKLEEENVKSYIIDLRFNGGGYVTQALDIGGHFVGHKPVVVMKDNAERTYTYYGYDHNKIVEKPIIFLVNEYSASASEILSAAVKDYGKAFFIGKTTYGKGVAQNMFPLSDGSFIKITTSKFFSPKGNVIQHKGITPDFETSTKDSFETAALLLSNINEDGKLFKLNSKELKEIVKDKNDKTISITFNQEIDANTVNNENIELVAEGSIEKVPVEFTLDKENKVVVNLKEGFKENQTYYFIVNDKIKSKAGKSLTAGAVMKIVVK